MFGKTTLFLGAALIASFLQTAQANTTYDFTPLGTLSGAANYSYAAAINNAGQVVGYGVQQGYLRATLWSSGNIIDLHSSFPANSFSSAEARDINDAGQIVGVALSGDGPHAVIWNNGSYSDLNPLGFGGGHYAYAINSAGQTAGSSPPSLGFPHPGIAIIWHNGNRIELGGQGEAYSGGYGINDAGLVAGSRAMPTTLEDGSIYYAPLRATIWDGTNVTDLGTLNEGGYSEALDINNAGQVVGYGSAASDPNIVHAILWEGGGIIDLGTLGGSDSTALAINQIGQIVGSSKISGDTETHATLWHNGIIIDLNNYLDASTASAGWVLVQANDINDDGWIVGVASNANLGIGMQGFLLSVTAVPEPATYAMFMAGLGLVGFKGRRRANRKSQA